ncbi:hypothetical protein H7F51_01335 [Novosphingobium flavum]|uniref:Heme exporter protein D n=1 Tax=Novosphingobium flavum TaxID=1778672 RepID=A0A7X1KK43_9SPHN|nr:hypothetical protein [Novosphingobium flavum]MBC2664154.1 hypothetical protein [Novosphingobium flavum]
MIEPRLLIAYGLIAVLLGSIAAAIITWRRRILRDREMRWHTRLSPRQAMRQKRH